MQGRCVCYPEWKGAECETIWSECPDPNCSGQGRCVTGECLCFDGYGGDACQFSKLQFFRAPHALGFRMVRSTILLIPFWAEGVKTSQHVIHMMCGCGNGFISFQADKISSYLSLLFSFCWSCHIFDISCYSCSSWVSIGNLSWTPSWVSPKKDLLCIFSWSSELKGVDFSRIHAHILPREYSHWHNWTTESIHFRSLSFYSGWIVCWVYVFSFVVWPLKWWPTNSIFPFISNSTTSRLPRGGLEPQESDVLCCLRTPASRLSLYNPLLAR